MCVSGTWSTAITVRNTIDGATSYGEGVAPVDLDGTFRTVATFTAPTPGGTYILDADATIGQNQGIVAVGVLANTECAWFNSGGVQAGPSSSASAAVQLSVVSSNTVNLGIKAKTVVATTATLRCRVNNVVSITLGDYRANTWAFEATRTA